MLSINDDFEVEVLTGGEEPRARCSRLSAGAGDGIALPHTLSFLHEEATHVTVEGDEAIIMYEREGVESQSVIRHVAHDAIGRSEDRCPLEHGNVGAFVGNPEALFVGRIVEGGGDFPDRIHWPRKRESSLPPTLRIPPTPSNSFILSIPELPECFADTIFRCTLILEEHHELPARSVPLLLPFRDIGVREAVLLLFEESQLVAENLPFPPENFLLPPRSADFALRILHQLCRLLPTPSHRPRSPTCSEEEGTHEKDDAGTSHIHGRN